MLSEEFVRYEPSVDSESRDERIAARRLRIERRKEAEKKLLFQSDESEVEKLQEEISNAGKQLSESHKALQRLRVEGLEIVTSVKITRDAEEVERRANEEEAEKLRNKKVHDENENALGMLNEVNQQWEEALSKTTARELSKMLLQQKEACDSMLEEKDKLITEFRQVLKGKDKEYVEELKRQAADIELLVQRMNDQVDQLTKAYKHELKQTEAVFIEERMSMLAEMNEEWKKLLRERRQKEEDYLKNRDSQVETYEKQLNQQRIADSEEYNKTKIKLEKDIQVLQQQIQEMRATYQLNQEKLEYNFQVLRKRDEENTITKCYQKKKLTHLHDNLVALKTKNNQGEKLHVVAYNQQVQGHKHLVKRYKDFLQKAKQTIDNNLTQFRSVWIMNELECKKLTKKLLKIDKAINEQQLGLPWTPPDISFMDNVGPLNNPSAAFESKLKFESKACGPEKPKLPSAKAKSISEAKEVQKEQFEVDYFYEPIKEIDECLDRVPKELIKHIFQLICDETGFLIEEKVWQLLSSLDANEQMLMKLDSILNVLQVKSEEDITKLSLYFMKNSTKSKHVYDDKAAQPNEFGIMDKDKENVLKNIESSVISPFPTVTHLSNDEGSFALSERSAHLPDGFREILFAPNEVLLALKAFVSDHQEVVVETVSKEELHDVEFDVDNITNEISDKAMDNSLAPIPKPQIKDLLMKHDLMKAFEECEIHVNNRDDSMDEEYWSKYTNVVGHKTNDAWDSVLKHFEKYHTTLKERVKLLKERDNLAKQNRELHALLHHCICKMEDKKN